MQETFESLGIKGPWKERLQHKGIDRPAPIQLAALPVLLGGGDAVIRSKTGTGKTLAYLLPVLERLDPESNRLQAIILAPTAELAMQIAKEAAELTEDSAIRTLALIGGASLKRQVEKLKLHPQLVVGTPGRIVELMKLKKVKASDVATVVIDEADQTFALGAGGEAESILDALRSRKQTVFCSATMPEAAKELAAKWLKDAQWIETEPEGEKQGERLPAAVKHVLLMTAERDRIDMVRRLIRMVKPQAAILFVNETESIAEVESKLRYHGLDVEAIYGDQPKQERTAVMRRFRGGKLKLLLATDVAARGLDASDVSHVIHVDPPYDAERYLHRAGRTGRMGRSGVSVLLLTPNRKFIAAKFESQLGIAFEEMGMRGGELKPAGSREASREGKPKASSAVSVSAEKDKEKEKPLAADRRPAKPAKAERAKVMTAAPRKKASRTRDQKNKGAPRWLKEKRAANGGREDGRSSTE